MWDMDVNVPIIYIVKHVFCQILFSPIETSSTDTGSVMDSSLPPSQPRRHERHDMQRHSTQSRRKKQRKHFIAESLKPVVRRFGRICACYCAGEENVLLSYEMHVLELDSRLRLRPHPVLTRS